ncbi:hypothetical protein E2C01_035344 [Portunus trituberculatus]|uniref:Uncharacterized protein n=1 Tax=Portunus trituberculatus TaxID=210409 RepID=A0A5B7F3Z2_PORTR|nr:hypothetical protein [Portunus trituberculatus]
MRSVKGQEGMLVRITTQQQAVSLPCHCGNKRVETRYVTYTIQGNVRVGCREEKMGGAPVLTGRWLKEECQLAVWHLASRYQGARHGRYSEHHSRGENIPGSHRHTT